MCSYEISYEKGLVLLEYHLVLNHLFLVQVVPCPIRALLSVPTVFQDPVSVFELDCRLHLGDELVVDADVAVGGPTNHELLLVVLANAVEEKEVNEKLQEVLTLRRGFQDCREGRS